MRTSTSPARRRLGRGSAALTGAALLAPGLARPLRTTPATAAPGDLDPAFAGGGRAALGNGWRVVALDDLTDDRFVTVSIRPTDTDSLDVRRFTPTGVADPSFAGDGNVQVGGPVSWVAPAVAVDRNGLTYVSAFADNAGFSRVWRFTGAGALDPAWGAGTGRVDFNGSRFLDIALQPDGRLVVANGASVYRLTAAGAVDTTFGSVRRHHPGHRPDRLAAGARRRLRRRRGPQHHQRRRVPARQERRHRRRLRSGRAGDLPPDAAARLGGRRHPGGDRRGAERRSRRGGHRHRRAERHQRQPPLPPPRHPLHRRAAAPTRRSPPPATTRFSISGKLSIQADDKVIVPIVDGPRAALLRLEPDGRRDTTFGTNGGWTDPQVDTRPTATLVQRPGRIVVTGVATGQTGLLWAFHGDPTPKCQGRYATAYGSSASDVLVGGDGDDVIVGGKGKD